MVNEFIWVIVWEDGLFRFKFYFYIVYMSFYAFLCCVTQLVYFRCILDIYNRRGGNSEFVQTLPKSSLNWNKCNRKIRNWRCPQGRTGRSSCAIKQKASQGKLFLSDLSAFLSCSTLFSRRSGVNFNSISLC